MYPGLFTYERDLGQKRRGRCGGGLKFLLSFKDNCYPLSVNVWWSFESVGSHKQIYRANEQQLL